MTKNNKKTAAKIGVKDILKLRHAINKSVTYGGMNAKEIEEFKEINLNQWKKVRNDYNKWISGVHLFNTIIVIIILFLSVAAFFYFSGWPKTISAIIAFYSLFEIAKREGHREGYMDGYESGLDEGINKSLGIDDKEAINIAESAIEMEIDGSLINELEKEGKNKK